MSLKSSMANAWLKFAYLLSEEELLARAKQVLNQPVRFDEEVPPTRAMYLNPEAARLREESDEDIFKDLPTGSFLVRGEGDLEELTASHQGPFGIGLPPKTSLLLSTSSMEQSDPDDDDFAPVRSDGDDDDDEAAATNDDMDTDSQDVTYGTYPPPDLAHSFSE